MDIITRSEYVSNTVELMLDSEATLEEDFRLALESLEEATCAARDASLKRANQVEQSYQKKLAKLKEGTERRGGVEGSSSEVREGEEGMAALTGLKRRISELEILNEEAEEGQSLLECELRDLREAQ